MFYTIYDAIVFKTEKNGIKEDEVKKRLRKRGLTSEQLGLLEKQLYHTFNRRYSRYNI